MIHKKLLEIQKLWIQISKDAKNPFYKSDYVTLDNIVNTYNKVLSDHGLVCFHSVEDSELVTILRCTEDDSLVHSSFPIDAADPQKVWSAITYGKRYNLWALLNIVTDKDDDGNKSSGKVVKKTDTKKKEEVQDGLPF